MVKVEDNQNTQKENIVSFQEISFRLYQPEEVESMGHPLHSGCCFYILRIFLSLLLRAGSIVVTV